MWWEIRRLVVVVFVVDLAIALACLGVCLALGAVDRNSMGTALFVAAVAMAFCSAGVGGGPVRMGMPFDQRLEHGSVLLESQQTAMEATTRARNIQYEIDQFRNVSWMLVLAIAAVTLFLVSGALILA